LTRLNKIIPIKETNKNVNQVLCYAGAGIYDLELFLKPFKREPHSVLGSIFLNPTVAGGVAFGSGGTHVRKGPAYTERALYCRIDERGKVQVVNRLGLKR
jgi:D-lactate dehydrogenase